MWCSGPPVTIRVEKALGSIGTHKLQSNLECSYHKCKFDSIQESNLDVLRFGERCMNMVGLANYFHFSGKCAIN